MIVRSLTYEMGSLCCRVEFSNIEYEQRKNDQGALRSTNSNGAENLRGF